MRRALAFALGAAVLAAAAWSYTAGHWPAIIEHVLDIVREAT